MPDLVKIGIRGWAGRTPSLSLLLVVPFVFCLCTLGTASCSYRWTEIDQGYLAHTPTGTGVPPNKKF